jgi:DNA repair photolyase
VDIPIKGRGAQTNPANRFLKLYRLPDEGMGLEEEGTAVRTSYYIEKPKTIVNKVTSPDLGMAYSVNPYQGCEHGCAYCYARPTHEYWGFSAGLDFESKIIIKENAPQLLREKLSARTWIPDVISISGNTDCYQPIERDKRLTRGLLEVCLEFRNPVGLITKNALIQRDLDLLTALAKLNLVSVAISITTLDEQLRLSMEPRTASISKRFATIQALASRGVPVMVMVAPVIPGLTDHDMPGIIQRAAEAGASSAGYTLVRLNGAVATVFEDWIRAHVPDRADKVLKQVTQAHGGTMNDSTWGRRLKGEGELPEVIGQMFAMAKRQHMPGRSIPELRTDLFRVPQSQLSLF